jgi:hypothetical protein
MVNARSTTPAAAPRRAEFRAGRHPADAVQGALRDLEAASLGLAGEAALCTRSAIEELRAALAALRENGDLADGGRSDDARADAPDPAAPDGSPTT